MLWQYIESNYKENQPILSSALNIPGMTPTNLRQSLKNLTDKGKLKRFDAGVYFIPRKSLLKDGTTISADKVIEAKYIKNNNGVCGYYTGLKFANMLGITTQVPVTRELVTNNTAAKIRTIEIPGAKLIVRKAKTEITSENYRTLQFLDILGNIYNYSELPVNVLNRKLRTYMQSADISGNMIRKYISYYPDKIARIMIEMGLVNVSA